MQIAVVDGVSDMLVIPRLNVDLSTVVCALVAYVALRWSYPPLSETLGLSCIIKELFLQQSNQSTPVCLLWYRDNK